MKDLAQSLSKAANGDSDATRDCLFSLEALKNDQSMREVIMTCTKDEFSDF